MKPDYEELARDIARALFAGANTVRRLTRHWPTDGGHREALLREMIATRLPPRFKPDTGFVVTPSVQSRQVDILITDSEKPVPSRAANGPVFVTPDAARALIEVKSGLSGEKAYKEALLQVAESAVLCPSAWTGLFVLEPVGQASAQLHRTVLRALRDIASATGVCVNCVGIGPSLFFRYWERSIDVGGVHDGPAWHSYFMNDLAPAYFIGNIVAELSSIPPEYETIWFPVKRGKEMMRKWYVPADGEPQEFPPYM